MECREVRVKTVQRRRRGCYCDTDFRIDSDLRHALNS